MFRERVRGCNGRSLSHVQGHPAFQTDASLDQQLAAFLLAEKLPPYIEFSQAAQKQIFGSGIKHQVGAG